MSHGLGEAIMGLIAAAILLYIAFDAGYRLGWAECREHTHARLLGIGARAARDRSGLGRAVLRAQGEKAQLERERLP